MTTEQRTAIIDLLLLAIYSDSHISISEEEALEKAIAEQGWDSEYPKDLYLAKASARAREAAESDDTLKAKIKECAAFFTTAPAQAAAYSIVHSVLSADGVADPEQKFLSKLNKAFPVPFL
jgi:uncharacterized tellurite resistance protein B-like protein